MRIKGTLRFLTQLRLRIPDPRTVAQTAFAPDVRHSLPDCRMESSPWYARSVHCLPSAQLLQEVALLEEVMPPWARCREVAVAAAHPRPVRDNVLFDSCFLLPVEYTTSPATQSNPFTRIIPIINKDHVYYKEGNRLFQHSVHNYRSLYSIAFATYEITHNCYVSLSSQIFFFFCNGDIRFFFVSNGFFKSKICSKVNRVTQHALRDCITLSSH